MNTTMSPIVLDTVRGENYIEQEIRIPDNLLYFEGHFPDIPILPGVIQLKWCFELIQLFDGTLSKFEKMRAIKFHDLVRPGDVCTMRVSFNEARSECEFKLYNTSKKLASAHITL